MRKRTAAVKLIHKFELQALAIRTNKIYLQELPQVERKPIEFYLDIEGTPESETYYLIGLATYDGTRLSYQSLWADDANFEKEMCVAFFRLISKYPDAPRVTAFSLMLPEFPKTALTQFRRFPLADCAAVVYAGANSCIGQVRPLTLGSAHI